MADPERASVAVAGVANRMERVVIVGAGGHARVVLDCLRRAGRFEVAGFLDPRCVGQSIEGVPVLGGDELLAKLPSEGIGLAIIGIGSIGDNSLRRRLFEQGRAAGLQFVNAVHPSAVVADSVVLGSGVAIMAGAVVNAGTMLGDNSIVNTGAIVEHDCVVAAHAQIAPGAVLCGGASIGIAAHVGAGATILQGVTIGDSAVIGAGSVVLADVAARTVAAGVPARPVKDPGEGS